MSSDDMNTMLDDLNVIDARDRFAIHRLRAKPVEYAVEIRHFVAGNEWMVGVTVCNVADDEVNKRRVADDLRTAAEMIEASIASDGPECVLGVPRS